MQSQKLFAATVRSLIFLTILLALSLPCVRGRAGVGVAAAPLAALSGTVTVCASGCDYTSLTLAGGLFAAINAEGLSGDLVAEIRGDLTAETGANRLNQWTDDGGPWMLTIQPAGGVTRTVSINVHTALINLNGADRVTIDGLNSGGNALVIRRTGIGQATIRLVNGASNNTVRNCTVEGFVPYRSSTPDGVIRLGGGRITRSPTTSSRVSATHLGRRAF